MFGYKTLLVSVVLVVACAFAVTAQSMNPAPPEEPTVTAAPAPQDNDEAYTLK